MRLNKMYCIAVKTKSGHEFDRRLNQEQTNRVLRRPNPLLLSKELSSRAVKIIFHPHPPKHPHTHTHTTLAHNIQQQKQISTQAALLQRISSGLIISWQCESDRLQHKACVPKVTLLTCSFWAGELLHYPPPPPEKKKKQKKEKSMAGLLHKFYSQ